MKYLFHRPGQTVLHDLGIGVIIAIIAGIIGVGVLGSRLGPLNNFAVTSDQVFAVKSGYTGARAFISRYLCTYRNTDPAGNVYSACEGITPNPCPAGVTASLSNQCADYNIVIRMQAADAAVATAIEDLESDVAACDEAIDAGQDRSVVNECRGLGALLTTAQRAVGAATSLAVAVGFGGG